MGLIGRLVGKAASGITPAISLATFGSAPKPRHASFNCCSGAPVSKFASARQFAAGAEGMRERVGGAEEVMRQAFKGSSRGVMPF